MVAQKHDSWDQYSDSCHYMVGKHISQYNFRLCSCWKHVLKEKNMLSQADSSLEAVVAEEAVSEVIKCLDEIKVIIPGNVTKQQERTSTRMKQGAPKPVLKV